jgi:peptidoglycan hydrolase-like protein with peptidoglycan-binding domain
MKKGYVVLIVLIFALGVASVRIQAQQDQQIEVVTSFDPAKGELPEGIAIDKIGNIYVSVGPPFFVGGGYGAVLRISPDGTKTTVLAEYPDGPAPAGLAVDAPGNVYFAVPEPGGANGGVYRVSGERWCRTVAWNGKYDRSQRPGSRQAGESLRQRFGLRCYLAYPIWRICPAEIWLQHELIAGCTAEEFGANGIAFWKGNLFVANTSRGALVHIPVMTDGSPGEPAVVAGNLDCEPEGLFGMDGIALDVHGNVYALLVLQNKLVRINPADGSIALLLDEDDGLWNASSITFGTGKR